MNLQHLGVFIVIIDKSKLKILLGKRKNSYHAGTYGFPGGRLDVHESLINCGKRELLEETGLIANKLKYLCVIRELQENFNFIHFAYLCSDYTGIPHVMEKNKCDSWTWYALDKLPKNILPAHKIAINLLVHSDFPRIYDLI